MSFEIGDIVMHVGQGKYRVFFKTAVNGETIYCHAKSLHDNSEIIFNPDGTIGREEERSPIVFHAEGYKPPVGGKEPTRFKKGDTVVYNYKDPELTMDYDQLGIVDTVGSDGLTLLADYDADKEEWNLASVTFNEVKPLDVCLPRDYENK